MNLKSILILLLLFGTFLLTLSIVKSSAFSGNDFLDWEETPQIADMPDIIGPDRVCLVVGNVIEDFFGAGLPDLDVYTWNIKGPNGEDLYKGTGGASFQTISFTFSKIGEHNIELFVRRGGQNLPTISKKVNVVKGPEIFLKENYSLCLGESFSAFAIDPNSDDIDDYVFEWMKDSNVLLGEATNNLTINEIGNYAVKYYFINNKGEKECENILKTEVSLPIDFILQSSSQKTCPGDFVDIKPSQPISGIWSYEKLGSGERKNISTGNSVSLFPLNDLEGYGEYEIFFTIVNNDISACKIEKSVPLSFNPNPSFKISTTGTSLCNASDGILKIQAFTDLDQIYYLENDTIISTSLSLKAGETFEFKNLKSGVYTVIGFLGGCTDRLAAVVPLNNPPELLSFDVEDLTPETCSENGKLEGGFMAVFKNGPVVDAEYKLINQRGAIVREGKLDKVSFLDFNLPGGIYFLEVFDTTDGCKIPVNEEIEVLGLPQVDFYVPPILNICQSYDLTPQTDFEVSFRLIYPDKREELKGPKESFSLTEEGEYVMIATHNFDSQICPRERRFRVNLIDPVDFESEFITQDCFGNQTYKVKLKNKPLDEVLIRWYNELGVEMGTGLEMYPVSYGIYKLDVQPANSFACPIPPIAFEVKRPVLQVDVDLTATPLCPFGPGAIIDIDSDFDEVDRIDWVYFDLDNNQIELTAEQNKRSITVTDEGLYEAIVWNRFECELGREIITIDKNTNLVNFDIEDVYTVCERFQVGPTTTEDLDYTITYPDGQQIIINSQKMFTLDQEGSYTIRGESNDVNNLVCPNEKVFEVYLVSPIDFEPKLVDQTCFGQFTFEADISGTDPSLTIFTWTNESGQLVGDQQIFITSIPGNYSLEVQPIGSLPCDILPINFEIIDPVLALNVVLNAGALCPEADFAILTAETEFDSVDKIEWWFTDINGNESALDQLNKKEIFAVKEGTYEVRVFNALGCFLGEDRALILRSTDSVRPLVMENYLICAQYEIGETINPGSFANYNWFINDSLVSISANYKPQLVGDYSLVVNSIEGCEYATAFTVEEECELKLALPSAIRPGDPERGFLIYTNYLVDEMEVWVFNKWGTLVFHCDNKSLISEESTCFWDGLIDGEKIPNGAYAIKIAYKNIEKDINKTLMETILVID